jgi:predicted methyltransferase MtxX (methanogen marker protein 4)
VVEVYDLAQAANSKLANISTRGFVDTGSNVMIGGLIVGGGSSGGTTRVIVRAIGPSLGNAGIQGALQDPTLELHDGNGTTIATNDNWKVSDTGGSQQAEIEATSVPPTDDREAALVHTLVSGNYTAIVRGANSSTGVGVVEAYQLQ